VSGILSDSRTLSYDCGSYAWFPSTYQRSPFHFPRDACTNPHYLLDCSDVTEFSKSCVLFLGTLFLLGLDQLIILSQNGLFFFKVRTLRGRWKLYQQPTINLLAIGYLEKAMYVGIYFWVSSNFSFFRFFLHQLFPSLFTSFHPIDHRTWRFFPLFLLSL